mmetsp:Transcript_10412/g.31220  ORF Transcript_10412/g.31220 Transcript_10412/m.31220 type:complete len:335 (-) Transcript_10412:1399-2403(-)
MDTSVNAMLKQAGADFRLEAAAGCPAAWADEVTLAHLIDHTGLGMHYVNGVPRTVEMPAAISLIKGEHSEDLGYERILVHKKPGVTFGYSGGGFLVLQTLLEALESRSIEDIMRPFLDSVGMRDFSFVQRENLPGVPYATGYFDDGSRVPGGRLMFPPLAAGGLGSTRALANFWRHMLDAYAGGARGDERPISHATAAAMLTAAEDKGSGDFMNARMGMGVFVADAGPNRVALHQAANEGFRGMYLICFEGPDSGKGYVICSNGDNESAICIAKAVQYLLIKSGWQGINHDLLRSRQDFDFSGIKQEEIVNFAFKALVFDAFASAAPDSPHSRL